MTGKGKQAPTKAATSTKKKVTEVTESSSDESSPDDSNTILKALAAQIALFGDGSIDLRVDRYTKLF
jgi:hypothetical protein